MPKSNRKNKLRDVTPKHLRAMLDERQASEHAPIILYEHTTVIAVAQEKAVSIQALTRLMRQHGYIHVSGYLPPSDESAVQS